MSIFGSIMSKIFGHSSAAATTGAAQPSGATAATGQPGGSPAASTGAQAAPQQSVDVGAVLTDLASKNPQKLNWQQSIVDLMKLLDLDSSLEARKQLAQELHYSGDTND